MPVKNNKRNVVPEEAKAAETTVVESVESEVKATKTKKKITKKGYVFNCDLLNVRKNASKDSEVVKVLSSGTEIEILETEGDFYKIAEGYVMKTFINC